MYTLENPGSYMLTFFEMTPDLVCIAGKDGFFKKVNRAVIELLGYSEEELFARHISSFIYPEDREITRRRRTKLLDGTALENFENRYVTKDGRIVWLHWTSIYLPDKEVVFAIAKDVTKRKQVEKEIEEKYQKFKDLATHFKISTEIERKNLAFELHEELAQLAAVIKMDIDWISANMPRLSGVLKRRMEHVSAILALSINKIRKISFTISPHMLDLLGLNDTLTSLCKEFLFLSNIPCVFESAYDEADLTYEIKLDFFRICQEALNNIILHAHAKSVKISIDDIDDEICLCIIDDGKGFDIKQQKRTSGLVGMRERAVSINGRFTIESETGRGTRICVTVAKQFEPEVNLTHRIKKTRAFL
jgi:PAS domain S-box-containing protein